MIFYEFPTSSDSLVLHEPVWERFTAPFFLPADFAGWTSADVTSSPRETLRACEEHCCVHIHTGFSHLFQAIFIKYCHPMIIESMNMESSEDEALLGEESEDENSELSDSEVSSS